jgi:hypothetical protein
VDRRSEPERSADRDPVEYYVTEAKSRASRSASGIGAAVVSAEFDDRGHVRECIVTDGREWHYVEVIGTDASLSADVPPEAVEAAVERFAETLPEGYRLGGVVNANPLHLTGAGEVVD